MAIHRAGANLSDVTPLRFGTPLKTVGASKAVARRNPVMHLDEQAPRPLATPSLKPIPPRAAAAASMSIRTPAGPPEKPFVIGRPGVHLDEQAPQPRATPSLRPIPPRGTVAASESVPTYPMLLEKTVAMARDHMVLGGHETQQNFDPLGDDASNLQFTPMVQLTPWPPLPPRPPKSRRAVWLGAALLAVVASVYVYVHPFTTTQAPPPAPGGIDGTLGAAQPAMAAAEPGTVIQDCPTCPKMTVLPAGRFKQGSAHNDRDALPAEKPQHVVRIRQPLAMSTTEITVANFQEFAADTNRELAGCETYDGEWHGKANASWKDPGFAQAADHPVTCVSWSDAVAYAGWLSAKTGHRYRLPSASEWEYAARSGSNAQLPWSPGLQAACENANVADRSAARRYPKWSVFACKDGYVNTAPVGSFKANAFGLNDMLGNVVEWTQDCWHDDYVKAPIDGSARMDGDCNEHELRGGSWFSSPPFVRLAYRDHDAAGFRSSSIGVRLVREMTP